MTGLKFTFQKVLNLKIFNSISLFTIFILGFTNVGNSQCDLSNRYDRIISGYHASIALTQSGIYAVWGAKMGNNGSSDRTSPVEITATNMGVTSAALGTVYKAALGGSSAGSAVDQAIILTSTGLWTWGVEDAVIDNSLTSSSAFARITSPTGANSFGLPTGVNPIDVNTIFATNQTLLLTTKIVNGVGGDVWILTQISGAVEANGSTGTSGSNQWKRVKKSATANDFLTNVTAARGQVTDNTQNAFIALTSTGDVYTWGNTTYLGNNTASSSKSYATLITLPQESSANITVSMIGVTGGSNVTYNTIYLSSTSGNLYSLGDNTRKQLGDFTTVTENRNWVRVKKSATANDYMTNVDFFSCQEHNSSYPSIGVVITNGNMFLWGYNSYKMLGQSTDDASYNPSIPGGYNPSVDKSLYIECGGHTTLYLREGSTQFCYVGHRIQGSMGDGTSDSQTEATFNCSSTPSLAICGSVPFPGSLTNSLITANPSSIVASGTSTSVITVQLKQANGTNLTTTGGNVVIYSNKGTIGSVTNNNNGTYTAILTSSTSVESATLSYTLNGNNGVNTATVNFIAATNPVLSSSGTLKTFSTCSGCSVAPQSFTVSGVDLSTNNIVVAAPTGFEVSTTSNSGYATSINLTPTAGTVTTTIVYTRLINNAASVASGVISITSTGATSKTMTVTTNTDNALMLDGVDDFVDLGDILDNTNLANTTEAWVYWKGSANAHTEIFSKDVVQSVAITSGNNLHSNFGNGTGWSSGLNSTTLIPLNKWTHIAITRSNTGVVKMYINGVLDASTNTMNVLGNNSAIHCIGAKKVGASMFGLFSGAIDNIKVWDEEKSAADVANGMYAELKGNETNLLAYYNFNQGIASGTNTSITTIQDLGPSSYNGTISGVSLTGSTSNLVSGVITDIKAAGNASTVIVSSTLSLTNTLFGGVWSSSNTNIATVNASTGLVTGIAGGNVTMTYTVCDKQAFYSITVLVPTLTTGTLKTFTSCSGCSIPPQSFTVSGANLTSNVTVNAPIGFEISNASNGTYTSTLTLIPSSGTLSSSTVFARLKNSAIPATNGIFTVTATNAISKTITATVNTDNALNFDGVDDVISTASNITSLNITGDITVETWIRLNQMPTDYVRLIGKGSITERTYGLWLYSDGSLLWQQFNTTNPSIKNLITNSSIIPVGKWCHIAVTRTGTNVKIYVNGNEVISSSDYTGTPNSSTAPLEIGGTPSIHTLLNGMMDEVRIWNVGRTSSQIVGSYLSELVGNETGLVAYYNFNHGIAGGSNSSISVIEDRSSNGISGTLTNFAKTGSTSNFVAGLIPPISGNSILYKGQTTNYTNGLTGGTWSSSATNIATVDANTGVVTGVNTGTSTISYSICNKTVSQLITVVVPTITTTGSLTNFSTCAGTASSAQTFTVSAAYLTASLTITAPTGYEVSLTSSGSYTNTLTIVPSSGTVSNTSIFVRLKSSAYNGATGNIVSSSISATSKNVATGVASVTANVASSVSISSNAISNVTCTGNNVIFTATPTNGGSTPTYQWKVNGVNVGTNTRTYATTSLANNDVVTVVMGSSLSSCVTGTPASSNSITITVNSTPNTPGVITGNNTICLGSSVVYSISSVAGATSYNWVVSGNISTSTSTSTVLNALASNTAGVATVKVRAVNACGISSYTADYNITISNTPAPTANFTISNNQVCVGNVINFTDASAVNATTNSPITSYSWNYGDGSGVVTTQNASRTYLAGGTYNIVFNVQSQDNCNASISKTVIVDPLSVGGTASANNASVCAGTGTSISLSGNVGTIQWMSSPAGANTWTNIINATGTSFNTGNLTASTDFKAVVTSGLCSSASSNIVTVTVNPIPSMTLSVPSLVSNAANSFDLGYTILAGSPDNYTINAISPNSMPGYTSINNYGLTSNPLTISIPVTSNGIYNFELIANNATSGCNSAAIPFNINIADLPPAGLSYTTPNVYTVGTIISSLSPTSTGGPILSYSITPSLPAGLNLNTSNGIISGTPLAISSQTNYIVTGTNGSGSITATVVITVIIAPPTGLSYNTPNVYTVGNAITSLTPTITGGAISTYTISPSLSAGLSINPNTGVISGTPSEVASQTSYIVTGTNTSGTISATVVITVNIAPPSGLSYNSPNVYTVGTAISTLVPTSSGGAISSYAVNPSLPSGLILNSTTGNITGTPTIATPQANYVVTGTNNSGTVSATIIITVNIAAPASLSYLSPNVYTVGSAITPLNPSSTGGTISQFSIAPNLPSGLTLNPTSGIISGTPTVISSQTSYIVTGNNITGSISATVVITVISGTQPPAPPIVQNGKFIFGKSTIPNTLNPFVGTLPVGVVPVWCTPGTTNCSTITPVMPTAIGTYVYQLRTYDTAKQLYSTDFVNNTIVIAPPPPIVFDSTYVVGVVNNPLNVGLQVSGLTGATFNYYYLGVLQNVVPVLGKSIGSKNYAVSQTVNGVESDTVSFAVTMLDPNSIIHLQKIVDTAIMQVNSSYNYPFTLVVTNLTKYNFSKVVVTDDLNNSVSNTSEFSIVKNMATGSLAANSSFDGKSDINVTTASSSLAAFAKDTAKFTMNLIPKGYYGILSNIAYVKADTKWGTIIMQSSDKSSNDLNSKNPTTYVVKDLNVYIPEGFSPNNDGVHDNFVIIRPFGVKLDIQIFNRWGNVVYTNADYQNDWNGQGTGNFAGQDLVNGGYYYTVKASNEMGKTQIFKGFVIIQR